MPAAGFGHEKGPNLLYDNAPPHIAQPSLQKLNKLGYKALPRPPCSPDLLPTDYHFFKRLNDFLQGKYFHNQQEACQIPKPEYLCYRNKQAYFSLTIMCWLMVPILINKDVLEPSCNLKFTSKSSITFYQHNAVVLASFIEIYWHLTCKFKVCLWWFDTCIYCEMITTVGPANIFIPSYNYLFWLKMQKLFNSLSIYFPTSVSTFSASQWVQL